MTLLALNLPDEFFPWEESTSPGKHTRHFDQIARSSDDAESNPVSLTTWTNFQRFRSFEVFSGDSLTPVPVIDPVHLLLKEIEQEGEERTRNLFKAYFLSRGEARKHLRNFVVHSLAISPLIHTAINEFRRKGNEDRLIDAGAMLEDFPPSESYSALCELADLDIKENYVFLRAADSIECTREQRADLLNRFACSRFPEVAAAANSFLRTE
ncbi:MAG: hypothetical protein HYZ13_03830 [Acidobacteria bacterium]|nr:hypothetical protein [Acidobacteriota bacterium]